MTDISSKDLVWMYKKMVESRYFEETLVNIYSEGKTPIFNIGAGTIPGEMHLSAGQEPAAVGMCVHLTADDTVAATHRPHHQAVAKDVDLKKMMAEIFGKVTGLGKGKGGHMHLFDPKVHFSCGGIIGAGIPHAVGAALASQKRGTQHVAVAFIGEGAANAGSFHESLNLASLWKLPFILVIENNKYGISVPQDKSTCIASNDLRASAYGIPGELVKNNDPIAMYEASKRAVERARKGEGPTIIEIETDRYLGHFQGDPEVYRDKNEVPELKKNDPIRKMRKNLIDTGILSEEEAVNYEEEVKKLVDDAVAFARESDYPAPEAAMEDVFC